MPDPRLTYTEQLADPRWIEKRNAIVERDGHECRECGARRRLEVHHTYYVPGRMAWEYPDDSLTTLCRHCHERAGDYARRIASLVGMLSFPAQSRIVFLLRLLIGCFYESGEGFETLYGEAQQVFFELAHASHWKRFTKWILVRRGHDRKCRNTRAELVAYHVTKFYVDILRGVALDPVEKAIVNSREHNAIKYYDPEADPDGSVLLALSDQLDARRRDEVERAEQIANAWRWFDAEATPDA